MIRGEWFSIRQLRKSVRRAESVILSLLLVLSLSATVPGVVTADPNGEVVGAEIDDVTDRNNNQNIAIST